MDGINEKFEKVVKDGLLQFAKRNPGTAMAQKVKTEAGLVEMCERVKQVKAKEFRHQPMASVEDIAWWIDGNELDTEND